MGNSFFPLHISLPHSFSLPPTLDFHAIIVCTKHFIISKDSFQWSVRAIECIFFLFAPSISATCNIRALHKYSMVFACGYQFRTVYKTSFKVYFVHSIGCLLPERTRPNLSDRTLFLAAFGCCVARILSM